MALLQDGRIEEAEKSFLAALIESPAHAPSSVQLARIYSRSGRGEEARRTLQQALEHRPDGIVLLNELGSLLLGEKEAEEARTLFERAAAVDPKNPRARLGLAESLGERGDLAGALEALNEASSLGVFHPGLDVYRATVLTRLGRAVEAFTVLERVLERNPDATEAERQLGLLSYALNRDSEAAHFLERALERNPADAEVRITLGKLFFRRADYESARRVFEALPASEEAHFYLGEIERSSQRFEDAAAHYRTSSSAAARRGLGAALLKLGRYEEGEKALEEALAIETDPRARAETLYLLGTLRSERRDDEGAVAALTEASKTNPHHLEARYLLGTTLARLGRRDEAERELEAFRRLKAFDEQKGRLELAILERPAEAGSYQPLIELYLEHGRAAEALPLLEKALSLAPEDQGLRELSARLRESESRC